MCQHSLELHVLSHVVLGPLSDVTHLTFIYNPFLHSGNTNLDCTMALCVLYNVSPEDVSLTHIWQVGVWHVDNTIKEKWGVRAKAFETMWYGAKNNTKIPSLRFTSILPAHNTKSLEASRLWQIIFILFCDFCPRSPLSRIPRCSLYLSLLPAVTLRCVALRCVERKSQLCLQAHTSLYPPLRSISRSGGAFQLLLERLLSASPHPSWGAY